MEEFTNHEEIAVLGVKLDNIANVLNQIVTQTAHIEERVDKLEQSRFAMRTIATILAVMLPFVIGIGSYTLNLHIEHVVTRELESSVRSEVERILRQGGYN